MSIYLKLSECYSGLEPSLPPRRQSPAIKPPRPPKPETDLDTGPLVLVRKDLFTTTPKSFVPPRQSPIKPPRPPKPSKPMSLPSPIRPRPPRPQTPNRPRCYCDSCTNLQEIFNDLPKTGTDKALNIMIPASQLNHQHASFSYVELDLPPPNVPKESNPPKPSKRTSYITINSELSIAFKKIRKCVSHLDREYKRVEAIFLSEV